MPPTRTNAIGLLTRVAVRTGAKCELTMPVSTVAQLSKVFGYPSS
jgi:hypothetical protein